jgi:S1-C subfamily serine protease
MYNLPNLNLKVFKNKIFLGVFCLFLAFIIGITSIYLLFPLQIKDFLKNIKIPEIKIDFIKEKSVKEKTLPYVSDISYEQAIIDSAKKVSPSVVSIIISKDMPVYEQQYINPFRDNFYDPFGMFPDIKIPQRVQKGSELQEVGAGSGFIVSADGMIVTNKHVVYDSKAQYTVVTSEGREYSAKVLALDPVQDLAIIKIQKGDKQFTPVIMGNSEGIQIGQTVIAIGNALGQFSNTVSVGVVSGLGRTISASDRTGGFLEKLEGIIQTDTAINSGNSGGPLINLKGEVIGVNVAMAEGAQNIGFALPINLAKKDIEQVNKNNKIVYPFLGIRYVLLEQGGAKVSKGDNGEVAVTVGSAAEKAGIKESDIILEIDGEKIAINNSMAKIIQKYNPGDTVNLHILRGDKEIDLKVTLGERTE